MIKTLPELFKRAEGPMQTANAWISPLPHINTYLRVQQTVLDRFVVERVLTIANVVTEDQYRHRGIFTRCLELLEASTDMPIVIENVLTEYLHPFLLSKGYSRLPMNASGCQPSSYFKRKP